MSKTVHLNKATRIEGNANIHLEIENGKVHAARFLVPDFRGFETFTKGRRVEFIPSLVSRICGICSASHQIASLMAIEEALEVRVPESVSALREIILLGERISSHALSYFFLNIPDAHGNFMNLLNSNPEIAREAMALRHYGQQIVTILGQRSTHPISLEVGGLRLPPSSANLRQILSTAEAICKKVEYLLKDIENLNTFEEDTFIPSDQQANFLTYYRKGLADKGEFQVYDEFGQLKLSFEKDQMVHNISEISAQWSFAKFPYLSHFGFPPGMVLVGPLSRSFRPEGILDEESQFPSDFVQNLKNKDHRNLVLLDIYRFLEIYWAAKRILDLIKEVELSEINTKVKLNQTGKGMGVIEAPRGVLVHDYLVKEGCIEKMHLLVATQFNNAMINLMLKDLAEQNMHGNSLSTKGDQQIGKCIRKFDPCISCASH